MNCLGLNPYISLDKCGNQNIVFLKNKRFEAQILNLVETTLLSLKALGNQVYTKPVIRPAL